MRLAQLYFPFTTCWKKNIALYNNNPMMIKDCYFNKIGVIVKFRNAEKHYYKSKNLVYRFCISLIAITKSK